MFLCVHNPSLNTSIKEKDLLINALKIKLKTILTAVSSQDEDMGHFEIPDPMEESTTSLVSSSTSAYSSFPVDVVVYVRVQVMDFIYSSVF